MVDVIESLLESMGYFGIAFLMFAENLFPPIPSELIMPLVGFSAARGDMNLALVIIAGSIGSIAGAILWYYIGLWFGAERLKRYAASHGRWITLSPQEIERAQDFFAKHGGSVVLFGRLIPGIRSVISIPAGIAGMNMAAFLAYSLTGTIIWTALLATAGYLLESQYELIVDWIDPVSKIVLAGVVLLYLYRVVTFEPQTKP